MPVQKTSKNEILAAALQCFLEKGYSDTTMRGIAETLGITHGSIFNYFHSKAELALCVIDSFFTVWFDACEKHYGSASALTHFSALSVINFTFMLRNRSFGTFLCDFMDSNQDYYLENTSPWVAKYVSFYSLNDMTDKTKSALDIMVLNHTSMKLISMLLAQGIDMPDACLYITSLDNYLWNLGGDSFEIKKNINEILTDPEHILLQTVEEMESAVFQS